MTRSRAIIGTAGHVDHGKTAMIRALTGQDLDQLPEERERGITIALGFTSLTLPSGDTVSLVDVPGHEALVRTMIAGASGLDAVLLCVSAVDGVMPQTREHIGICHLLGLTQGAVVLTMTDLVDEDLLAMAVDDASDATVGTFLEGAPVVCLSSETGDGVDDLIGVIDAFGPSCRDNDGPFRLPIDQVFSRPGFGTVARGTVQSGVVHKGDRVTLAPTALSARVRNIQHHNADATEATAGQRIALNLGGVDRADVHRGTVLSDVPLPAARVIDITYAHLPGAPALSDGAPVRLLTGTSDALGRLYFAEERDQIQGRAVSLAQVRVDTPIPCLPGDPVIVRRPSPEDTFGGGHVLDPWAPRMRHRDRLAAGKALARLRDGDRGVFLERAREDGLSPADALARAGALGHRVGDRVFSPGVVGRLEGALFEALQAFHTDQPLSLGAQRRELHRGRLQHLPEKVFEGLIDRLVVAGLAEVQGPLLRLKGFGVRLTKDQLAARTRLLATVEGAGLSGVSTDALTASHPGPETTSLIHLLASDGALVAIGDVGWIAASSLSTLTADVATWFNAHDTLSPAEFKMISDQSRKAAIPLLEWLDAQGATRRVADHRVRGDRP